MNDPALIRLYKHMAWANHRVFTQLSELPEEALSFSAWNPEWTVGAIANHIVIGQSRLISRLKKVDAPTDISFPLTSAGMKELAAKSLRNDEEFLNWIDKPEEMLTFIRYGETVSFLNTTIVAQAVNHGIEHRAQIADILAVNKMDVINLDSLDPISYERAHR
jgi:uncharacterized damage-inducible protein DinB